MPDPSVVQKMEKYINYFYEDEKGEPPAKQQKYEPMPQQQEEQEEHHPPLNITKNVNGKDRDYYYLTTVNSLEEMNEFRLKNFCIFYTRKPLHICKSFTMPCARKKRLKTCDFELMAMCPNLDDGIMHIYAHSQHSHVLMSEEKRSLRKKELVPDANPPAIRTEDNIEWTFLQTFSDQDKLEECRLRNHCAPRSRNKKTCCRISFNCHRRNKCKFMLMAMRTTEQRFHVYRHGEHEHNYRPPVISPTYLNHSKEGEQSTSTYGQMDEQEQMEDDEDEIVVLEPAGYEQDEGEEGGSMEIEVIDVGPPRNITKNIHPLESEAKRSRMAQIGKPMPAAVVHANPPMFFDAVDKIEWSFFKAFSNKKEMETFRDINQCLYKSRSSTVEDQWWHRFACIHQSSHNCQFMFLEIKNTNLGYQVYRHGEHNHPLEYEAQIRKTEMPAAVVHENLPMISIFDAVDKIEWTFVKTFPNKVEMKKFRVQNQCLYKSRAATAAKDQWRRRYACSSQSSHNCQFMFLVIKNTKPGYHVYRHGQHNHQIITPQIEQSARSHQQNKEQIVEDDDDIILIEEDEMQQRGDEERKVSVKTEGIEENPVLKEGANCSEESVDGKRLKVNEKVHNWMEGIDEPIVEDKKMMNSP